MIKIKEIPVEQIDEFWEIHIQYLVEDGIIEPGDVEYFSGDEYRQVIKEHMIRDTDKHHMVYFLKDNHKVGACQFTTYLSEDWKCFVLDFWIFKHYRGAGLGKTCFKALEDYTRANGATYYVINYSNERNHHFWKSIGFIDDGVDEYNMPLMVKR